MIDFSAFYRKHAPEVFRFALHLCGDRSQAEDIVSETFVRLWTSPNPIEMATVKGYLFTIARNLFLQKQRNKARGAGSDKELGDLQANQASPYSRAEQKAELRAVLARLQKLPEVDRAALLMRAVDGMPYEEIARTLGISLAAVKVKIHRARLALQEIRDA